MEELSKEIPPFVMTRGASKATELLNENLYNKVFTADIIPNEEVRMIYKIYFQLLDRNEIIELSTVEEFWKACCHYFIIEGNGKTGN